MRPPIHEPPFPFDPVVEAYKKNIDLSLLRANLRRSVEERLCNLQRLAEAAEALRAAGAAARKMP
jgi:hypothetical protein